MTLDQSRAMGIDVSIWQREVDWPTVKAAGIEFAFAKASEGTDFTDPTFAANWPAMEAAGLLRGAYHYYQPDEDPEAQARHFADVVGGLDPGDLPPVLDVEEKPTVTRDVLLDGVQRCLVAIEQAFGSRPLVYTSPGFWGSYMRDDNGAPPDWTGSYHLWLANYTDDPSPLLPRGWSRWLFWQHTGSGEVDGVKTAVDRNWFDGSADDLRLWSKPPKLTNQAMINAFANAFGDNFWEVVTRAGQTSLAIPRSNRDLPYQGPPPGEMPGLTDDERVKLKAAVAAVQAPSPERGLESAPIEPRVPRITNGTLRHAFYLAFGQAYAERIAAAGLAETLGPRRHSELPYAGASVDSLPGLRKSEKAKLKAALARAQGLR
ncbi:MAG: GH25 family lysozyme [Anaerolineae bacterium]